MGILPTLEELKAAHGAAPAYIRDYISSEELAKVFNEIRDTNKLHLDEAGQLSLALSAVFLEVRPAEQFPELLKEALEVNQGAHAAVLKTVNEKVFARFREILSQKTLTQVETSAPPEKKPPAALEAAPAIKEGSAGASATTTRPSSDPYREPIE